MSMLMKTSNYCLKITSKLVVTPLLHGYNFFPPLLFVGVKLHMPPGAYRCVAPPPPPSP